MASSAEAPASSPSASTSSTSTSSPPPPVVASSPYPFAAAPDIIRAHQKDAYFAGTLANDLADLVLRFAGGRAAHAWAAETRTAAELAYWGLTAGRGCRTLGEEYCDLVEVQPARRLRAGAGALVVPAGPTRAAHVLLSVLAPYLVGRSLPGVRRALRRRLEARVAALEARQQQQQQQHKASPTATAATRLALPFYRYLLAHLDSLTSGTHVRAATLALFYFYGAYYTLTTRLLGLRYVFTRRRNAGGASSSSDDVVGYEVLGALLVLQLAVQGYLHVRDTLRGIAPGTSSSSSSSSSSSPSRYTPVPVSLNHDHSYTPNNDLLLDNAAADAAATGTSTSSTSTSTSTTAPGTSLAALTHTPDTPLDPDTGLPGYRVSLAAAQPAMRWLGTSRAQRQCTLCLEALKDPSATPCGHVFCWRCIGDWVREKPECPLCRRAAQPQHILPLQV